MKCPWRWLILSLAMASGGCGSPATATPDKPMEQSAMDTIELRPGENFILELEGNPSTGYSWQVVNPDPEIVSAQSQGFKSSIPDPRIAGARGKFIWQLKALQPGRTQLTFQYYRPWEKFDPARNEARTFTIRVQ